MKNNKQHRSLTRKPSNQDKRRAKGIHEYKVIDEKGTLKCIHCNHIGKDNGKGKNSPNTKRIKK